MPLKKIRRRVGDVLAIPLSDGMYGFGLVLPDPLMAFYDLQCESIPALEMITNSPIAFKIWTHNTPITSGQWERIGRITCLDELLEEPLCYKKDLISGELTIYRNSTQEEVPATVQECEGLECAAVWAPEHILDRLQDHFAGRPNIWVESLRP